MNHVLLAPSLLYAVKINDYYLYGACLSKMVDLFFSFDGQNYARYLGYFSLFLVNIVKTHPELLKLDAISVAKSFIPANKCAVDFYALKKHLCNMSNLKLAQAGGALTF